ncbi:toll/interleukin-1 receptor domain-containing protein [Maricaulis sp. CAU 1757]
MRAFLSYAHEDERYKAQILKHLALMKREGLIDVWHDREIRVGQDIGNTIDANLESADLFIALISSDFLSSEYCFSVEMRRGLERAGQGDCIFATVIVRSCDWQSAEFAKLLVLPTDGKPISRWADIDEAYTNVALELRKAISEWVKRKGRTDKLKELSPQDRSPKGVLVDRPKSANLTIKKNFSDLEKDIFLKNGFEYIAKYLEASAEELSTRNSPIDYSTEQNGERVLLKVYRDGSIVSQIQARLGNHIGGRGISISYGVNASRPGAINEMLGLADDGVELYLTPILGFHTGAENGKKLSFEGASEYIWSFVIEPLQGD